VILKYSDNFSLDEPLKSSGPTFQGLLKTKALHSCIWCEPVDKVTGDWEIVTGFATVGETYS